MQESSECTRDFLNSIDCAEKAAEAAGSVESGAKEEALPPAAHAAGNQVNRISKTLSASCLHANGRSIEEHASSSDGQDANSDINVLSMAYYNLGVEQEYLRQHDRAANSYASAHKIALENLGNDHPMTLAISRVLGEAEAIAVKSRHRKGKTLRKR